LGLPVWAKRVLCDDAQRNALARIGEVRDYRQAAVARP